MTPTAPPARGAEHPLFDVIEVQIAPPNAVRVLARDLDAANADATMLMAVARRGVEDSFFKVVPAGSREDTDHG